ncbi:hypothetical protein OC539_19265 [Paracoccus denitrificans]|uniref:Pectate lyase superfamily protein domain-containing protein n=3 Tax=Paracoccus denitrificans TaxID=266 RepID=A1B827_PARDP|nr:hypothetical protein [Paracoccus denitrificans]ABL71671.1 hypothetical protein Pden_3604 [Paracoccus denitrificans PD1222]MBB4629385.1 hypothetical protein [Paracoccus denitrificans]MCU7430470.1 hypothetical protein [Paracoccus denitrificans]UPV97996.1 hypothetical protein M0K93_18340 [Paracoccus denitrificans]WQO35913.1 hypothetical protein U0005_15625 [Paracoccus denitrificans]
MQIIIWGADQQVTAVNVPLINLPIPNLSEMAALQQQVAEDAQAAADSAATVAGMQDDIDLAVEVSGEADAKATAAQLPPFVPFATRADIALTNLGDVRRISVAGVGDYRQAVGPIAYTPAAISADGIMLVPDGPITPQHFGARADLEYELQQIRGSGGVLTDAYGLVRTGGTNDRAAIVAADFYAALMDQPLVFPPGRYFIDGTIRPTTRWLSEDDFGAVLWLNYNEDETGRSTSGLEFFKSGTGLGVIGNHGFRLIGQFSRTTPKEGGNGQLGTVWRINDYYMPHEQPVLVGMHIRAKVVRAALQRNESGTITQRSIPSIQGAVMAGVEHSYFEIGVWGRTNVASTAPLLVHWGCRYAPESLDDTLGPDKTLARIIETYHACWIKVTYITPLDNRDGHNFLQPFDLACTGPADVYGVDSIGLAGGATGVNFGGALGSISCGDICDAYAIPRHKAVLWKGINIYSPKASGVNSALGSEQLYIKGMGTAKYPGDVEPGTDLPIQRQLRAEINVYNPQCSYAEDAVPGDQRTAFIDTVFGSVTIQNLSSFGAHRAIEIEDTWGRVLVDGVSGDGATLVNFAGSVDLLDQRMDRRNAQNAGDSSNYAFGWGSPNSRAVEIAGALTTIGTVAADLTISDNIIPLAAPTSAQVPTGVKLRIGNQVVQSTRMHRVGAVQLSVTPLSAPILTGATVIADRRSKVGRLELATRSSFHALDVNNSDVADLDMTRMAYAGRNAVRLRGDSVVTVNGGRLPIMGRAGGDMRTFRAEGTSRVNLNGVYIPDNPAITTHVALIGGASSLSVRDCIVENPATIVAYGSRGQVSWAGNRKPDGSRAVWGGYEATWTPSLLIGGVDAGITYGTRQGSFVVQEDGMVTVRFDFTLTSKGTETGILTLGGIPFDCNTPNAFPIFMHFATLTDGTPLISTNGSVWTLSRQTTTGVASLTETQIGDTTRFRGSLTYRTTL